MQSIASIIEPEQFPQAVVFHRGATAPAKVIAQVPARLPISLEVLITGTAVVNVYGSNLTDDPADVVNWGLALLTYTASAKVILEDEPWTRFMIEIASVNGVVSAAMGA